MAARTDAKRSGRPNKRTPTPYDGAKVSSHSCNLFLLRLRSQDAQHVLKSTRSVCISMHLDSTKMQCHWAELTIVYAVGTVQGELGREKARRHVCEL